MVSLRIGEVAERTGLTAPTIRYYESIGLLPSPVRSESGYRRYSKETVNELAFIKKGQALGFSLDELREVLALSRSGRPPCTHVLTMARRHLAAVEERIRQFLRFRDQLSAELAKWEGRPATCRGLCQIIASSKAEPALERGDLEPRRRTRRTGRARAPA
jgi:MerR family mercuric resistance operon transcriptional regulator